MWCTKREVFQLSVNLIAIMFLAKSLNKVSFWNNPLLMNLLFKKMK